MTPVEFQLSNAGAASVYVYEGCIPDLTSTELAHPSQAVGRLDGCPICECQALSCRQATCGACFDSGQEIAAGTTETYSWIPVDVAVESQGTNTCTHTTALFPGHYRIDVPTYASAVDAAAKTNARVVSQAFDLPADTVDVALAR